MIVKRCGKYIIGAQFTKDEQKAIDIELQKMKKETLDALETDVDAQVLWFLHKHLGFGKQRLLAAFDVFSTCIQELGNYYEMPDDGGFVAKEKLKDMGIDIDKLRGE